MGKKKGSKKKGSKKKSAGSKGDSGGGIVRAGPTQLELSLRLELQQLETQLDLAKRDTELARQQNEYLHEEVEQTLEQNMEYEAYIEKKSDKEKLLIDSMTDVHAREYEAIESERNHLNLDAARIKKELNDQMLLKEEEIEKTLEEIDKLSDVSKKRDEQQDEIRRLEQEIEKTQQEHFEELQSLKSSFLTDKLEFQQGARDQVRTLELQAEQHAVNCLNKHAEAIKSENKRLRSTLLSLMQNNKELGKKETRLKEQNAELSRQLELNAHIVRIGNVRAST